MMKENKTTVNGGIGFVGLLTIVFIVLKLTGYIKWSWVWVLSPIWIEVALIVIGFGIYALIVVTLKHSRKKKAERYRKVREAMEKAEERVATELNNSEEFLDVFGTHQS